MNTLEFIQQKYELDFTGKMPVKLNISRFGGFPELLRDLNFKIGAEIGVANGRFSRRLCQKIEGLKLFCIDPWLSYPEYVEHHDEQGQVILDGCFETAKTRLAPYNCEFIRKTSMDAVGMIEDNSLDFVFIDGNHSFKWVVEDIHEWSKKVRSGGIIAGHDFWRSVNTKPNLVYTPSPDEIMKLCQVKDVVESWTYAHQIRPWFEITGDKCHSWFWVKV